MIKRQGWRLGGSWIRVAAAGGLALAVLATAAGTVSGGASTVAAAGREGAVYTLTNQATGNSVAVFERGPNGGLTAAGTVSTGGLGTGGGLGSQGAIVLSHNNHWLFAVNAGSNDVSVFRVHDSGLALTGKFGSGGVHPISVTVHDDLLYVLNDGVAGTIAGFAIGDDGHLSAIAGSNQPLSNSAAGPAQIQFSNDGDQLVVTEKANSKIDTYSVGADGVASPPVVHDSEGATPFGFAFGKHGDLIVSEAFGGAPDASALSSYRLSSDGDLTNVTATAATHQTAACWVAIAKNGRYAYTTNTGSGSVTGYRIARDGSLTLLDADGRTGVTGDGSSPLDLDLSSNGRFLYVLASGSHSIVAFQVDPDGSLTSITGASGLPAGAVGLAAQ